MKMQVEELTREKREANNTIAELRQRLTSLQQDLTTSEQVQKDFVRLSQSLQVQLERIRDAGSEVRWEHEEDVTECPTCHLQFSTLKKKLKVSVTKLLLFFF